MRGALPAPVANDPHTKILSYVTRFCTALHGAVYGQGQEKGLVQADRTIYDDFEAQISLTAPPFAACESVDEGRNEGDDTQ